MITISTNIIHGTNETQKTIFKSILNRPKTADELAEIVGCKTKTIDNQIPLLKKEIDQDDTLVWIKNFNKKGVANYSIVNKKDLSVKIEPKVYSYYRNESYPRIIINLPDPPAGFDKWIIVPLGDIHYGASSCDYQGFDEYLDFILATPNILIILNGDLIENASKDSPGASVFKQLFPPQDQKERLVNKLASIAHRILYSVKGNHGNRSVKQCFLDPERDISMLLEVEYFEGQCFADIVCQNHKWEFYSFHGTGSSNSPGGRLNLLTKKNAFHSANIYTMGHVHDLQCSRDYEIIKDDETMGLKTKKRYYVICGTFQKYWNDYAEEWALPPNMTGVPKIELYCDGSRKPGDYHVIT